MPRILNPVVLVVDSLAKLCKDPQLEAYVKSLYGSVQACRRAPCWLSAAHGNLAYGTLITEPSGPLASLFGRWPPRETLSSITCQCRRGALRVGIG